MARRIRHKHRKHHKKRLEAVQSLQSNAGADQRRKPEIRPPLPCKRERELLNSCREANYQTPYEFTHWWLFFKDRISFLSEFESWLECKEIAFGAHVMIDTDMTPPLTRGRVVAGRFVPYEDEDVQGWSRPDVWDEEANEYARDKGVMPNGLGTPVGHMGGHYWDKYLEGLERQRQPGYLQNFQRWWENKLPLVPVIPEPRGQTGVDHFIL